MGFILQVDFMFHYTNQTYAKNIVWEYIGPVSRKMFQDNFLFPNQISILFKIDVTAPSITHPMSTDSASVSKSDTWI